MNYCIEHDEEFEIEYGCTFCAKADAMFDIAWEEYSYEK